ncbi:MAG: type II toxin-antitoxin system VapB family antitoxin [Acidobacteriota bacterium]
MATNVELDEDLVDRAFAATGMRTKRELVHAGLRALVRLHAQREVRDLRGRLRWEEAEENPDTKGQG